MKRTTSKLTRRHLLQAGAGLAVTGVLPQVASAAEEPARPSVYEALGLKHVINASGNNTSLGGSLMPPEVVAAWVDASRHFVNLPELQDRVGERIAKLIGVEAALVTTGASGSMLLGTAAAVTGGDRKLIRRLPDTAGMKNEVILQKRHHSEYDNQMTDVGVKLIDVETAADVQKAVGKRTALMFFMNKAEPDGRIKGPEWIELAKRHQVPTLLDAAADVPPLERLAGYNRTGYDLVAFSAGKAMRGPNDTGLLLGRKDLIEAAKLNFNPHAPTIGRMMKVSKEDMIAVLAAVERFVKLDHKAEALRMDQALGVIEKALGDVPTVQCERVVPPIANHWPHLQVVWDERRLQVTRQQATQALAEGTPSIRVRAGGARSPGLLLSVVTLQPGEEQVLAERLRGVLRAARG